MASKRFSAGEAWSLASRRKTGKTFRVNAQIKAGCPRPAAAKLPAFADDSGLAVDALDGAPGIYSARWAGEGKDFMAADDPGGNACCRNAGANCAAATHGAISSPHYASHGRTIISKRSRRAVDGTLVWPPRGTGRIRLRPGVSCRMDIRVHSAK